MHSSRMRTVCSSDRNLGGVCSGEVSAPRGVSALGGSASWGVSALGGVCSWGVSASRGSAPGVSPPGGLSAPGGVCSGGCIPACTEADTPTPHGQTDACKNITFATSLRTVKITCISGMGRGVVLCLTSAVSSCVKGIDLILE